MDGINVLSQEFGILVRHADLIQAPGERRELELCQTVLLGTVHVTTEFLVLKLRLLERVYLAREHSEAGRNKRVLGCTMSPGGGQFGTQNVTEHEEVPAAAFNRLLVLPATKTDRLLK